MISLQKFLSDYFLLVVAGIILVFGAAVSFIDHDWFVEFFVVEDGPTEWLTFFVLLASALLCFKRWYNTGPSQPLSFKVVLLLLFAFFIFGAGEEISWGQRIFGIESSEFFLAHNKQSETNLHNLMLGDVNLNKLIFGTGFALILLVYLAVFTPLYHKHPRVKHWLDKMAVPIARKEHVIAFVVLLVVVELIMTSSKRGEITEVVGSLVVFATLLNPYNKSLFQSD